jgi:hypothetical protein
MINAIKKHAAQFIVKKKFVEKDFNEREFSRFFKRSFSFLVLMPTEDADFRHSFEVLNFLKQNKKNVIVLTNEFRISLLPPSYKANAIGHGVKDITTLKLPSRNLLNRISQTRFDVVLDLNRNEVTYYNYISSYIKSNVKIGFVRSNADKYFNLQILNKADDPEISYQNLLNCLKMF